MITLKLARGDNYESVPLRLPTTPGEVDEVFAALDAASRYAGEVQIIGVDSGVPSLAKHLKGAGLTDPDAFDKLNRLAEKIDGMDERQRDIFSGALDTESAGSLDDVLRVSDSLEAYTFVPNVRSDEELGRYVVVAGQLHGDRRFPEEAWPYLDFAKIGAEYFAGHGGAYTVSGYVMRREDGQQRRKEGDAVPPQAVAFLQARVTHLDEHHHQDDDREHQSKHVRGAHAFSSGAGATFSPGRDSETARAIVARTRKSADLIGLWEGSPPARGCICTPTSRTTRCERAAMTSAPIVSPKYSAG